MGKIVVNNKIGIKEELSVMDMVPGHTYQVTFNDGTISNVLVCYIDSWHVNVEDCERLVVSFDNSAAYVIDNNFISHIEHINIEVNITK